MSSNPFSRFSERSLRILFVTRMNAGNRGAPALGAGDLLEAIVTEDQGSFRERHWAVYSDNPEPLAPSSPFFSAETASQLLLRINDSLPRANAVPGSADMSVDPDLAHIFEAAAALAGQLHHEKVTPLHLLAAISAEENCEFAEILQSSGVTREAILEALSN
jgi:hypothetical protein